MTLVTCPKQRARIIEKRIRGSFIKKFGQNSAANRKDNEWIAMIRFIKGSPEEICRAGEIKEWLVNTTKDWDYYEFIPEIWLAYNIFRESLEQNEIYPILPTNEIRTFFDFCSLFLVPNKLLLLFVELEEKENLIVSEDHWNLLGFT